MDLAPPTERVGGLLKVVQWPDNYEVVTFIFESKLHGYWGPRLRMSVHSGWTELP
jgi:hypothetical protein